MMPMAAPPSLGANNEGNHNNLITDLDSHYNYLEDLEYGRHAHCPPRSCLMKTTISFFSTVPELSLSKVENTSSKASSENSSPDPRLPRVSWTNFLVSSLSRAPLLSPC